MSISSSVPENFSTSLPCPLVTNSAASLAVQSKTQPLKTIPSNISHNVILPYTTLDEEQCVSRYQLSAKL